MIVARSTPQAIAWRAEQAAKAEREAAAAERRKADRRYYRKPRPSAFVRRVAGDMGWYPIDDVFIAAIEGAAVTEAEYKADPDACQQRIQGACEELAPADHW